MPITADKLVNPVVSALVSAINAGDRNAFEAMLAPGATMSDDGTDRDVSSWIDREIFSANGRMAIQSQADGGTSLVALFRNDTWGEMRTNWRFTISDGVISHFETGQA